MHVFISDLHLTDEDVGGVVSDAQMTAFVVQIAKVAEERKQLLTLVFVGDVLELLRSRKWDALWVHESAPWSGMAPGFSNFLGSPSEGCAIEIAKAIQGRYREFSEKLKELVDSGKIVTKFVYGNHDYMVQLSPRLREVLIPLLSLSHRAADPFPLKYHEKSTSVFATHGHAADLVNWHEPVDGFWAMGDAIVLRIVNRIASEASKRLGVGPNTGIGRLLHEIDNIEPLADIPLYVRWVTETALSNATQRKKLEEFWSTVVQEFLDLKDFQDKRGYGSKAHQDVRTAFKWSTYMSLAELLPKVAGLFSGKGVDYSRVASNELSKSEQLYKFVLFGHTHQPMLVPISVVGGKPSFYVNTGCWRRLVTRTQGGGSLAFVARRVASYFEVDGATDNPTHERYHLHQEWHAT